tara:strand:- start:2218 stop:2766 length:549 start_codon:yes stop_codon:yes gene_type:complete
LGLDRYKRIIKNSGGMEKKVLSEQALYVGDVSMPKGFEIDRNELRANILESSVDNTDFKFSRSWDKLNTYIQENMNLKYNLKLRQKLSWGNFYKASTSTPPLLEVDLMNLNNSADFVLLYGVKVKDCLVKIFYEDNRRKAESWDIELINNMFIMFPSTNRYYIANNSNDSLNFVQTITYESL